MSYIIYPFGEAERKIKPSLIKNYDEQRQRIYELKIKTFSTNSENIFNEENLNLLSKKGKNLLKEITNELTHIGHFEGNALKNKAVIDDVIFNGNNDDAQIQKLINIAKDLKNVETFDTVTKKVNELQDSGNFVKEKLKKVLNSNNLFSISTKEYDKLIEQIELARNENEIQKVKDTAKNYYSGLIGQLGESLGRIYGYSYFTTQLKNQLAREEIKVNIKNAGTNRVEGSTAVGDTQIEFIYKDGQVLGNIGMSSKLTSSYNLKSHTVKMRTTSINQISQDYPKRLYYNLVSFHAKGDKVQEDLVKTAKESLSFRRYVAAMILYQKLFGSFKGDNVYLFNYGSHIITMETLLKYWIDGKGIPYVANISRSERLKALPIGAGINTPQKAEAIIGPMELKINSSIHMGNLFNMATKET